VVASQEAARRAAGILTAQSRAALAHEFVDEFRAALNDPPMRVWKAPSPSNRPWNCNSKRIVNVIILEGQDKKCPNLGGVSRIIRNQRYDIEYYFEWPLSRQVCYSETAFKTQR